MSPSTPLGKMYHDGDLILKQGDVGSCMYVIQSGQVEVILENGGQATRLAVRGAGDFFGEMALFEREKRMASVRALGDTWILTIDRKNFLRRIQADPDLAFRLVEEMSRRIRSLSNELAELKAA